jgi:hypothetical protein
MTRTCRETGEALLIPFKKLAEEESHITGDTGKLVEDERVSAGIIVAGKRL